MSDLSQLLRDTLAGEVNATESLIARFRQPIEQECAKFGISQHPELSQSDLYQEIVLRVWMKIGQFKTTDDETLAIVLDRWIRKTAQSVLKNLIRDGNARKRKPGNGIESYNEATQAFVLPEKYVPTPSSVLGNIEEAEHLSMAIEKWLDRDAQAILELRMVDGLSIKEISKRIGLTYEQVRYKYQLSLAELAKRLD